jgi:hypothetical protein
MKINFPNLTLNTKNFTLSIAKNNLNSTKQINTHINSKSHEKTLANLELGIY